MVPYKITADESLAKLKEGNRRYLDSERNSGDISKAIRLRTCIEGQNPYSDSKG